MVKPIEDYKPGSITRVKLHNFLTYADVEFRPGPRLNVVAGPNGTGKSTLLCAICLGLGGQPPLLGRADDARLFIMNEKDKASVEIELKPPDDNLTNELRDEMGEFVLDDRNGESCHVFRRVIDRNEGSQSERSRGQGASKYYINGRLTNLKTVKHIVTVVYGIQIDNLCTFLPQDKVGSFSGFTSNQLLVETEKCLLSKWYQVHQKLIELEHDVKQGGNSVEHVQEELKRLEEEAAQLEQQKQLMEQRREAEQQLHKLKQKKAWVQFDEARQAAIQLNDMRKQVKQMLKVAKQKLTPLLEAKELALERVQRSKANSSDLVEQVKKCELTYQKHLRKYERAEGEDMDDAIAELNSLEAQQRKAIKKANHQQAHVEQCQRELNEFESRDVLKANKDTLQREAQILLKENHKIRREQGQIQQQETHIKDSMRSLERELSKLEDTQMQRRNALFHRDSNLARTYQWIDQNRKQFRHPIHGPIVLDVQVDTSRGPNFAQRVSAYLEQHVQNNVWKQYVVESREDYNLLYKELRTKRGWAVNIAIVTQDQMNQPPKHLYSDELMETLKTNHGIEGYMDDFFTAPPAIMQALRQQARVDRVLIGSKTTQRSLDDERGILRQMLEEQGAGDKGRRTFCVFTQTPSGKHQKTQSTVSRYGNKSSSLRVDDVSAARMLLPGVSDEEKQRVRTSLEDYQSQLDELQPQMEDLQQKYEDILSKHQKASEDYQKAQQALNEYETARLKCQTAQKKLVDLQAQANQDYRQIKRDLAQRLKNSVHIATSALQAAETTHEQLLKTTMTLASIKLTEEGLEADYQTKLQSYEQQTEGLKALEDQAKKVSDDYNLSREELKRLKAEAEEIAPMLDPNTGEVLPLRGELESLPETLDELDDAIDECLAKMDTIVDNPDVFDEYSSRKQRLEEKKQSLQEMAHAQNHKEATLKNEFIPWEAALVNTTEKVNVLFGKYMMELGCAGEVRLSRGNATRENPMADFVNWGIQIWVKFRETASLQQLSAQVQSGGERSVSTIMYLMALQECMSHNVSRTGVPFRCVDEINQGLDERNERLVFKRIVENSTRPPSTTKQNDHCGQYFLITPKLLPNLTDMEHDEVTILLIFNGPYNFKHYSDWNIPQFIESQGHIHRSQNEEEQHEEQVHEIEQEDEEDASDDYNEDNEEEENNVEDKENEEDEQEADDVPQAGSTRRGRKRSSGGGGSTTTSRKRRSTRSG